MSGKTVRIFAVSVLLVAGSLNATAETAAPSESVTVTGNKLREVFGKFTKAFVTPTPLTGKIARWERRVCPIVTGQKPEFIRYITQRVRYVALAAGAPVNSEPSCKPNIEIVFTTTPQDLIDNVRKNDPGYLGYAETIAQRDGLIKVGRPIQAWYMTESVDLWGTRRQDSGWGLGTGVSMPDFHASGGDMATGTNFNGDHLSLPVTHVTGERTNDGVHTGFNHVLIVIDSSKLAGQRIVPLADYISMLALTQLNSLDACQEQPSIVSLLAGGCDHAVDSLTEFDLAYLQGLYKMNAGRYLMFQRNDIASAMADTLTKIK